jgi:hypothetical protein
MIRDGIVRLALASEDEHFVDQHLALLRLSNELHDLLSGTEVVIDIGDRDALNSPVRGLTASAAVAAVIAIHVRRLNIRIEGSNFFAVGSVTEMVQEFCGPE